MTSEVYAFIAKAVYDDAKATDMDVSSRAEACWERFEELDLKMVGPRTAVEAWGNAMLEKLEPSKQRA